MHEQQSCQMCHANSWWFLLLSPSLTRLLSHHQLFRSITIKHCFSLGSASMSSTHYFTSDKTLKWILKDSSPSSRHSFFTHLHLKNKWAPSSSNLLHMQQQVSNSMSLLFILHLRARECMQTTTCAHHFFFQKSKHFLNTFLSSKTWTQIFRYSHDTKFMVFSLILYFPYSHLACTAFHLSILN